MEPKEYAEKEKKGFEIRDIATIIGVMVSILVAVTTLLSVGGYVPSWWYHFSVISLVALAFIIPLVILSKPISKRLNEFKLQRKRNAVSRKYFSRLRELVETAARFNSPIKNILSDFGNYHAKDLDESLQNIIANEIHAESEIRNTLFYISNELDNSDRSFRDFYFLMKHFEFVLSIYKRYIGVIKDFALLIINVKEKAVAKPIEANFEELREKYNLFVNDYKHYCQVVNEEIGGEKMFPEWVVDHLKKW